MTTAMTTAPKNKKVNVFVTGATGTGKSTLIAVLAQALNGAGHATTVPPETPGVAAAISDLAEQFEVTFHEGVPTITGMDDETKFNTLMELTRQMHTLGQESRELQALISSHQAKRRMLDQEIEGRRREIRRLMGFPAKPVVAKMPDIARAAPATPGNDLLKDIEFVPLPVGPFTYAPNTCLPGHGTSVSEVRVTLDDVPPGQVSAVDKLMRANLNKLMRANLKKGSQEL